MFTIALTGGPCGGKSSSLSHFKAELEKRGVDVYTAAEVPTILISGGAAYPGLDNSERLMAFEKNLMALQFQIEESFVGIANSTGRASVVVMDRGVMDIAAYLPRDKWLEILAAQGLTEEDLLQRYDLVLHLVTAADGAEKFYTTGNNDARTETPAQARDLDKKVFEAYKAHPRQCRIDNAGAFQDKLQRATNSVLDLFYLRRRQSGDLSA